MKRSRNEPPAIPWTPCVGPNALSDLIDWTTTVVFGHPPDEGAVVRPSAYGLVASSGARLAVVRTPHGLFLPGGGIEPDESARDAVAREALEECGLELETGDWSVRAIDFVYSLAERTHFEKRSTFIDARSSGRRVASAEADHQLEWATPADAIASLAHPSHRWAIAQWLGRNKREP